MRVLTLCGSLRAHSSNRALLHAWARLAPAGLSVEHDARIGVLPHFNPDLDCDGDALPRAVAEFRSSVAQAAALVISTPEYAHGLPGAFKNALDWLVSDPTFAGKPVAILHIARNSTWAHDSLREVLKTMSSQLVDAASVSLPLTSNQRDEGAILAHPASHALLSASVRALANALAHASKPVAASTPPSAPSRA